MRWLNLLFVLLVNAVPLYGVKYLGWSVGTVLILYWLENLLIAAFTCARIALHRALTRKRGHWRPGVLGGEVDNRAVLLDDYAGFAILFTLAHGLFLGAFIFVIGPDSPSLQVSAHQFFQGAWQILVVLSADFVADALQIRSRSFAWIVAYAQQRRGRVVIMHLTIIFGIWAIAASQSPLSMLYVLIGLKTLWDLTATAAKPPNWLLKVAEKIRKAQGNDAKWQRECARVQPYAVEDEMVAAPQLPGQAQSRHSQPQRRNAVNFAFSASRPSKQRSLIVVWLMLLLGSLIVVEGAVSVWVAMKVAWGESATGKVIEFHHSGSGSHSASIVGQVDVVMPGGATFRDEVDDAMGSQDWIVGGNVALRCTHFYADHWSCSADSGFSRFLFPLFFLSIGVGIVWGSARNIRGRWSRVESPEPAARE